MFNLTQGPCTFFPNTSTCNLTHKTLPTLGIFQRKQHTLFRTKSEELLRIALASATWKGNCLPSCLVAKTRPDHPVYSVIKLPVKDLIELGQPGWVSCHINLHVQFDPRALYLLFPNTSSCHLTHKTLPSLAIFQRKTTHPFQNQIRRIVNNCTCQCYLKGQLLADRKSVV